MKKWTQEQVNACIAQCREKAVSDSVFRAELLKNPVAAVEKLTGEKLPDGIRLKVIENDPAYDATFVLPPMVSGSVSDDALDGVTGGRLCCGFDTCAFVTMCGRDK